VGRQERLPALCRRRRLLKQNRLQDSLSKFDRLLLQEPNHVAAITERSSVLLALKQYDVALAGIEKAIA